MTNSPFNLPLARYYGEEMVESVLGGPDLDVVFPKSRECSSCHPLKPGVDEGAGRNTRV